MKITFKGEMTISEARQAVFEKLHELEDQYGVRFTRGATLYVNPTDEHGNDVVARCASGRHVTQLHSHGPYRSAAAELKL